MGIRCEILLDSNIYRIQTTFIICPREDIYRVMAEARLWPEGHNLADNKQFGTGIGNLNFSGHN